MNNIYINIYLFFLSMLFSKLWKMKNDRDKHKGKYKLQYNNDVIPNHYQQIRQN